MLYYTISALIRPVIQSSFNAIGTGPVFIVSLVHIVLQFRFPALFPPVD